MLLWYQRCCIFVRYYTIISEVLKLYFLSKKKIVLPFLNASSPKNFDKQYGLNFWYLDDKYESIFNKGCTSDTAILNNLV